MLCFVTGNSRFAVVVAEVVCFSFGLLFYYCCCFPFFCFCYCFVVVVVFYIVVCLFL